MASNHIIRLGVQDCSGAFNIHDDFIVGGVDDNEHDERVLAVVRKSVQSGLTFNFKKLKINFMGHTMSDKGLRGTPRCGTLQDLTEKVWWPRMDKDVEAFVRVIQIN